MGQAFNIDYCQSKLRLAPQTSLYIGGVVMRNFEEF